MSYDQLKDKSTGLKPIKLGDRTGTGLSVRSTGGGLASLSGRGSLSGHGTTSVEKSLTNAATQLLGQLEIL